MFSIINNFKNESFIEKLYNKIQVNFFPKKKKIFDSSDKNNNLETSIKYNSYYDLNHSDYYYNIEKPVIFHESDIPVENIRIYYVESLKNSPDERIDIFESTYKKYINEINKDYKMNYLKQLDIMQNCELCLDNPLYIITNNYKINNEDCIKVL